MHTKIHHVLLFGLVALLIGFAGTWTGCSSEKPPECTSNLDCTKTDNAICVNEKCTVKAKEGEDCDLSIGLECMRENEDTPARPLICTPQKVCKIKCTTNFDCKTRNGETCNTSTGLCEKAGGSDGGSENVTESDAGKQESEDCSSTIACASGLDCVKANASIDEGKCWKTCKQDSECADTQICTGTHCVPKGEKCEVQGTTQVKPCWPGLKCVLEGAAEGSCRRECTDSTSCPKDFECAQKGSLGKFCVPKGNKVGAGQPCGNIGGNQVDCIDGYQCAKERLEDTKTVCLKKCSKDAECDWPKFCQGICTLGNAGNAKLGAPCDVASSATADKRCEGGHFCLVLGSGKTTGFCYRDCGDPRKTDCPSGLSCVNSSGTQKLCLKKCSKPEDCQNNGPASSCGKFQSGNDQICLHPSQ